MRVAAAALRAAIDDSSIVVAVKVTFDVNLPGLLHA